MRRWLLLRGDRLCGGSTVLGPVALSEARPTGDQEVAGSSPRRVRQHSFVEIGHEIFYSQSLPSADSRSAVVSFWWKNVHKYWLTA